jgi:hypothetical protein
MVGPDSDSVNPDPQMCSGFVVSYDFSLPNPHPDPLVTSKDPDQDRDLFLLS